MIRGEWRTPASGGRFSLSQGPVWFGQANCSYGSYEQLKLSLDVDPVGIIGIGKDIAGGYVVRGVYSTSDYVMRFAKQYIQAHVQVFFGNMTTENNTWVCRGSYNVP